MIEYVKKILSFNLILLMLFLSIGIQLHYHTCGKTGKKTYQLIDTPNCACEINNHNENHQSSCCHFDYDDIEHSFNKNNSNFQYLNNINCCKDELLSIALNDLFIYSISNDLIKIISINFIFLKTSFETLDISKINIINPFLKEKIQIPDNIIVYILKVSHLFSRSDNSSEINPII